MKKIYKIILWSILGIVLLLFSFALYVNVAGIPSYEYEAEDLVVELTESRITEGARMADFLCLHCHGSTDGRLGGKYLPDGEAFGEIYAPNITQHPQFGITKITDGELAYLFRSGRSH